jgi:hypothetical protein
MTNICSGKLENNGSFAFLCVMKTLPFNALFFSYPLLATYFYIIAGSMALKL